MLFPPSSFSRGIRRERPFILGLALAAVLFLLLATLGAATDWWRIDESFTWDMIQQSSAAMIARTKVDVHPPLYYLVLHACYLLWPRPEMMQAFSMAMGLGALLAAAMVGRLLRGARLGVLVALLWATFPFLLHYSQDARMYTMALFLETLGLVGWAMAPRRPRAGWLVFVASLTASLYTQNLCLIFAAALIGGEVLRWLMARRAGAPAAANKPGLAWILGAGVAIATAYAPWTLILRHQMQNSALKEVYNHPLWSDVIKGLFLYPYTVVPNHQVVFWAWGPGLLLLVLLPALWSLGALRRAAARKAESRDAGPIGILVWIAVAPLVFLILYSEYKMPVFEVRRHSLLFSPFLLFLTAAWLEARSRSKVGRLAALGIIALSGALALGALSQSRDKDLTRHIAAILERAPAASPIFVYPPIFPFVRLLWHPLDVQCQDSLDKFPRGVTRCTLVVAAGDGFLRESTLRQTKITMAQAARVKNIYSSYEVSAFALEGLPPGAMADLLKRTPFAENTFSGQHAGLFTPAIMWSPDELSKMPGAAGEIASLSANNPNWHVLRINKADATFRLPVKPEPDNTYGAILAGGNLYSEGKFDSFQTRLNQGLACQVEVRIREFLLAHMTCAGDAEKMLSLRTPEALVRRGYVPEGDIPPGVYLAWAGWRPLKRAEFQKHGYTGEYYDVGALGDELYLRSGFNEAEGVPPGEIRWSRGEFVAELPVWPGAPPREVVLWGRLNKNIRERRIGVEVTPSAGGRALHAEAVFERDLSGAYVLRLPEPLGPGIYAFRFTVGTWTPKDFGLGDPRQLGFYLDAIQLRPAP